MMEEVLIEFKSVEESPSNTQLKAMVEFIQKNKSMINTQTRQGMNKQTKCLWEELVSILNDLPGPSKNIQEWIKYWSEQKSMVCSDRKQSCGDKGSTNKSVLEEQIWEMCYQSSGNGSSPRKKRSVKKEPSEDEYDSSDNLPIKKQKGHRDTFQFEQPMPDVEGRHVAVMEKLVQVMDKQASALTVLANASLGISRAMERLAEASQIQAHAVERLASSFEGMGSAAHDIRNAIINIDYTMKRCYSVNLT